MTKMIVNMALGSALTLSAICFLHSKEGKKLKCKIAKMMD